MKIGDYVLLCPKCKEVRMRWRGKRKVYISPNLCWCGKCKEPAINYLEAQIKWKPIPSDGLVVNVK